MKHTANQVRAPGTPEDEPPGAADGAPVAPLDLAPAWVKRVENMKLRDLMIAFKLEAAEHRRIIFDRSAKFPEAWRDFRGFLLGVGPCPSEHHRVAPTTGERGYDADSRWKPKGAKRTGPAAAQRPAPDAVYSQWTAIGGKPVEYTTLSTSLGVPFSSVAVALNAGRKPDEIVQQSDVATTLVQEMGWFSSDSERQDAFRRAFRAWHMKVDERFANMATPRFLYLYILLPDMIRCKTALVEADLWDPLTDRQRHLRDASPLWKRYYELFPKAQVAVQDFDIYRQYSLTSQIEDLWTRVEATERKFRSRPRSASPKTEPKDD
ncbi:MAG: hypothetical protein WA840_12030 [Caulobacteraceae bacterium]